MTVYLREEISTHDLEKLDIESKALRYANGGDILMHVKRRCGEWDMFSMKVADESSIHGDALVIFNDSTPASIHKDDVRAFALALLKLADEKDWP